ncbi:MAG: cysteate synthase, partial [Bacteroidales bacterium]|nr:cysteate synthase [Bacteroidales bacterium]
MTNYKLRNYADGNLFEDTGWLLSDPSYNKPSLIRAIYDKKQIDVGDDSLGIYKFSDWLPINRTLEGSSATVTYKSKKLASKLGLSNLLI